MLHARVQYSCRQGGGYPSSRLRKHWQRATRPLVDIMPGQKVPGHVVWARFVLGVVVQGLGAHMTSNAHLRLQPSPS